MAQGSSLQTQRAGITGSLLSWLSNNLNNRSQRAVLPGVYSSWKSIKVGVPQGSILGTLLFLIYISLKIYTVRYAFSLTIQCLHNC